MASKKPAPYTSTKGLRWRSGTPKAVGWYICSDSKDPHVWRWWNGTTWSHPARSHLAASTAARRARKEAEMEWRKRPLMYSTWRPDNATPLQV
jgi:hypothetical protein